MRSYKDLNIDYQGNDLDIIQLQLTSLSGCPEHITGDFICKFNLLKTLAGGPRQVDRRYNCSDNHLTDLVGCASHISSELNLHNNNITSLVGIHKIIKKCQCFYFDTSSITQGGIGLLLINGLEIISNYKSPQFQIISEYFGTGTKGMMECSKELISKGFEQYAKL